jgi:predicted ATP-grasp superfamily ATP-dependent carboligase
MLQPAALDAGVAARLRALLDPLVAAFGLVGLNSLDVLVDDDGNFNVIELNPRPGAAVDVFDIGDAPLFALHVQACEGALPVSWELPPQSTAMSVVYADAETRVPDAVEWPDWVADRPAPGSIVGAGAPLCTVLATHATSKGARRLLDARVAALRSVPVTAHRGDDLRPAHMLPRPGPRHSDTHLAFDHPVSATGSGPAA